MLKHELQLTVALIQLVMSRSSLGMTDNRERQTDSEIEI